MKHFMTWVQAALVSAVVLAGPVAQAGLPSCLKRCEEDAKQCKTICTKYAGPKGAPSCATECGKARDQCVNECRDEAAGRDASRREQKEGRDEAR
ncbi:hypothetical protein ACQKGO_00510 [Corallococcus interemptor]|uniref:hypothetical protein n=1 Tax=Corallococcus interemptor TaxID=2316720 RepID=UPI00131524E8